MCSQLAAVNRKNTLAIDSKLSNVELRLVLLSYISNTCHTYLLNIMHVIMFFMIFLHSSFHFTHILNLHLFSVNLIKK